MPPMAPLFNPEEYFASRGSTLLSGLAVFALNVIGTILVIWLTAQLLVNRMNSLPPGLDRALFNVIGTMAIVIVVVSLIALLVIAAIMHVPARGDGTFVDAMAVAGWSYAPDVIVLPISFLVARWRIRQLPTNLSTREFTTQVQMIESSIGVPDVVISLFVVGWSVYILAKGTAGTHDVDVRKTIVPALVIGVGSLILRFL